MQVSNMNGFEFGAFWVLWLACALPVLCIGACFVAQCWISWRIISKQSAQIRTMIEAVLASSDKPFAAALASEMEVTDRKVALADLAAEEEVPMNGRPRHFRPAQ